MVAGCWPCCRGQRDARPHAAHQPAGPLLLPFSPAAATPMWRTVSGMTYCNADGLRLKRKLGLL